MDLLIRNARLRDRTGLACVGIRDGRIDRIAPDLPPDGRRVIDAAGSLTTPAFVEPHTHLDKALISDRMPPNVSMSSEEARRNLREEKGRFTASKPTILLDDAVARNQESDGVGSDGRAHGSRGARMTYCSRHLGIGRYPSRRDL